MIPGSLITFPRGARSCVLAHIERTQMRIAHLPSWTRANETATHWRIGEFGLVPGRIVKFNHHHSPTKETTP